jgi:UDP-GlcNAc:undecaprenyl-phosphate/decaprenyl-phosphate GlcNAc-1-phosphate transferase
MTAYLSPAFPGAVAFVVASLLVPPILWICTRLHIYDSPGPLKIHRVPIPRMGGVAIAVGVAISLALFPLSQRPAIPTWPFFAALALIWIAGLADDLRGLPPAVRIAAQAAAALLLWGAGWRLPLFTTGVASIVALCLFIIFFVNALNFLDGSDGLAAGVACIIAIIYIALPAGRESVFGRAVAWSLLGSCAGFLIFNLPPFAKIFMGDSGSTLLGFVIAFLALDFFRANNSAPAATTVFFPFLVAALPLLDAALAILRRLLSSRTPLSGDRSHFYDLLLLRGWSPRKVLLTSLAISAALSLIATACLHCSFAQVVLISASTLIALFVWIVRLGSLRAGENSSQQIEEGKLRQKPLAHNPARHSHQTT